MDYYGMRQTFKAAQASGDPGARAEALLAYIPAEKSVALTASKWPPRNFPCPFLP